MPVTVPPASTPCPLPFPTIEPWQSGLLAAGNGHALHHEQCGNPQGLPVLILHGGPGSGCSPRMRQLFDPARFRIVLFDQRGCGRSTPRGGCAHNTTADLVADIERLRLHLGIERWLVVGGSWGAALAIAYAAQHRDACLGAILRGVFLTGRADLEWFFVSAAALFPESWHLLDEAAPGDRERALPNRLFDAVLGGDVAIAIEAVRRWVQWETTLSDGSAAPAPEWADAGERDALLAKYRVQAHYLRHECFLGETRLLELAARLGTLPVAILHGEQDRVCRVENAERLHRAVPGSSLRIVPDAGHNPFSPAMLQAFADAVDFLHCRAITAPR